MEKIIDQKHPNQSFVYAGSRFFERASYYGFRSLFVLYMLSDSIQMERSEAFTIYGWFTGLIIAGQIIGAIVGDLLIGNKRTLIIGGVVQALGAFILCIPSIEALYIGLVFTLLGGGMYSPNLLSLYGKHYLNRPKLVDSGFSILYLAVNIGAFLGPLTIGFLGESVDWKAGFITAGICMLIATILPLFSKENTQIDKLGKYVSANYKVIFILVAITISGLFWAIYDFSYVGIKDIEMRFSEYSKLNISNAIWSSIQPMFIIPIGIAISIFWTFFYQKTLFKLALGFLFGAISFGILLLIPDVPNDSYLWIFLLSVILLSLSELYIAPITLSIITKYTNPKYLALLMSVMLVPFRIFYFLITFLQLQEGFYEKPMHVLIISASLLLIISLSLFTFFVLKSKHTIKE